MTLRDDITERAEARVGQVLKGKWRLDSVLGIGGMATVYAATHRNRSRVAIKMLHAEVAVSQDATSRFLREGYVGNGVAHPGTVRVLDDDVTEDGAPFLVMELLEGESLGARLHRDGSFLPFDAARLGYQLLDVMAAAHAAHIVHRDLKPDNVFLVPEGSVKVLDFGIARLRVSADDSGPSTQLGSLLGTPAFMAPEQALGRWNEVDERTDIWAIGATLFTLLTGRYVHEAESVQEQLVLAATRRAPSVAVYRPETPPWLADVIDKALSFGRDARYPDARSMQAALRESATGVEFHAYPWRTPGASQYPTSSHVPGGATSARFAVSRQSAGTFASVQAVARSAQNPAPRRRSKALQLGLAALGVVALPATFALLWRGRAAGAPEQGAEQPTAATLALPVAARIDATGAAPRDLPGTAGSAAASSAVPSPRALLAVSVKSPPVSKKPPATSKPRDPEPAEQKENLFDIRH